MKMPLQGSLNLVWGDQIKKKKKNCMKTSLQGFKTPLRIFLNAAIGMELELHELKFHANIYIYIYIYIYF